MCADGRRNNKTNKGTVIMSEKFDVNAYLLTEYSKAMTVASGKKRAVVVGLDTDIMQLLDIVVAHSESSKAVLTVLMTSVVYKICTPTQDIRLHQSSIEGGYSGRTFDTKYITPFLKAHSFPAMAESGWLTRSLEQKSPYDKNYKGAIKPKELKDAFLSILEDIENGNSSAYDVFSYLLQSLIIKRDNDVIELAKPANLSISDIILVLDKHFHAGYNAAGASRLPVLSLYAVYQCMMDEGFKRYVGKMLLSLESHTSADTRSGRMGDIDINDDAGLPFEAIEVKFDVPVSYNIVVNAVKKIHTSTVTRYYILSTKETVRDDREKIDDEVRKLKNTHGCQLVVNGVMPTLKYYLRLLDNPNKFIINYTRLLMTDNSLKFEHKQKWNEIISNL